MDQTSTSRLIDAAATAGRLLKPRPHSGRIWSDLLFLLLIGALHATVLPSLFGSFLLIDLMTPWLVTTIVAAPMPVAALVSLVGALVLETHSAAPAGLYVTAYWVVAVALWLTRGTLSWRHATPWLVTFFASSVWVITFETFVASVAGGTSTLSVGFLLTQLLRVAACVLFGMLCCHRFMVHGLDEEQT